MLSPDRLEDRVREAVGDGATLFIVDQVYEGRVPSLSEPYPDVEFAILERTTTGDGYAIEEGAFLMGAIAALEATQDGVGFVGAFQDRRSERLRAGFERGVNHVRPSLPVLAVYSLATAAPDPSRVSKSQAAATTIFETGARVVFNVAQDVGVLEAAFAETEPGALLYSLGAFTDEYSAVDAEHRKHALSSLIVRYDGVVFSMIEEYIENGDATPAGEWDIADGAMSYTRSSVELALVVDDRAEALIPRIISGAIEVPVVPVGDLIPIPGSYESTSVVITYDGGPCTSTDLDAAIGTVIDVEFFNNANISAYVAVGSDLSVEIPAIAGGRARGQVLMLEDTLRFECGQLDARQG